MRTIAILVAVVFGTGVAATSQDPRFAALDGQEEDASAEDDDTSLYLGIRQEKLFEQLSISVDSGFVSQRGVTYRPLSQEGDGGLDLREITLAVHKSAAVARSFFNASRMERAVGPSEEGTEIGSFYILYASRGKGGDDRANITVRENNIVIEFSCDCGASAVKELAAQIVKRLRNDREVTDIGSFPIEPEIRNRNVSFVRSASGGYVLIPTDARLGGNQRGLRPAALFDGWFRSVQVDEHGHIRFSADPRRYQNIKLLFANEENVYVQEDITITDK